MAQPAPATMIGGALEGYGPFVAVGNPPFHGAVGAGAPLQGIAQQ